ncbi:DUF6415 family natural product biosynthesis protein [Streptomyces sp. GMR22]|uniref:DUF6415 family natural product biosynthesis protein n=1 Tax=Streptomyces sp. GMR22 TaxID=2759524 RepID=UPI0015FE7368|nr:DUF6415 family natural product biosynthesis protein [Streptomyces sp. GMR22]MBA6440659.1 hypothetical protein [Streptomyces sp. GMR22]
MIAAHAIGKSGLREAVQWVPPLNAETLEHILIKMRGWEPLDCDAIFEDLANALDDQAPEDSEADQLACRLSDNLGQLVTIALAGLADQRDHETTVLVERAHTVRSKGKPIASWTAIGRLRRLAWVTNELLERLAQTGRIDVIP